VTDPAQAFLNHGNVDQWTRGVVPITGIGTTMGHGSWPIYEAPDKPKSWRVMGCSLTLPLGGWMGSPRHPRPRPWMTR